MATKRAVSQSSKSWFKGLAGVIVEGFKLHRFVGAGKIGYVYAAEHEDFPGSMRAVKLTFEIRPGWEAELKKVMQLQLVDGVVHFHALGAAQIVHDGITQLCQYTVWDYIAPGENLLGYLRRVGRVPVSLVLAVAERILHVLHACEANGIARHGDLHAGNVLVGDSSLARLDDTLQPRTPVWVSDFGYGATGGKVAPKDDYLGLIQIINKMVEHVDRASTTATDKQLLNALLHDIGKLLRERTGSERRKPLELLQLLSELKRTAQAGTSTAIHDVVDGGALTPEGTERPTVGQFQVSEMIGERWTWWRRLFVPTVPARSKILAVDIPTVVTGPRGCGKTMLFRRLSERLVVECGEVAGMPVADQFVAFYVNANDFADPFARFPETPRAEDEARLICYANLCVLSDLLAVQSARAGRFKEPASDALLSFVQRLLMPEDSVGLVVGEDRLERCRSVLDRIKWMFPGGKRELDFPGYQQLSQIRWLPYFVQQARGACPWMGQRAVLIFIDDFSTPRVSASMQRALNRLFLQRSSYFLAKVATEAWTTFVPEDSSGKTLQDGDDYQLVDMGEESLFLPDVERLVFLNDVFKRRLEADPRVPNTVTSLRQLLGTSGHTKTGFARQLRLSLQDMASDEKPRIAGGSQQRGRSRRRVHYSGDDVFSALWSGDTRTMIQLITDVVDQAVEAKHSGVLELPVAAGIQDRVFRARGGEWLNSHTRNEPTDPRRMRSELATLQASKPGYALSGEYGDHLKAVVEAFAAAATDLLLGPVYLIREGKPSAPPREVPRMAFRIEIVDEFRLDGLAKEIYRDLVRYGLFMRDNRGKSVRGTFVPRLYLRRLLLPFCTLALSKRDSVPLTCDKFKQLLLEPDRFKSAFQSRRMPGRPSNQFELPLLTGGGPPNELPDPAYEDLTDLDWAEASTESDHESATE